MALSPQQVGTSLGGGYVNTLGGPVDPYYANANGTPWASVAAACAAVPTAYRKTRTVNVNYVEYQWLNDVSDAGLLPKAGGSPSPGGVAGYEVRAYSPSEVILSLPKGLPRTQATIDSLRIAKVPKAPKPTSYDTTLDTSNPTADGANFSPDSNQALEINELTNLTGATNSFTLVDSSDNSENPADMDGAYTGAWFRFRRSDGTKIEATWGSTSQTITL